MAEIIDGKKISAQIKEEVKQEAERLLNFAASVSAVAISLSIIRYGVKI